MKVFRAMQHGAWSVACVVSLVGCASIMHGGSQDVGISSSPSNAQVEIDGRNMGATPMTTSLKRKESHTVTISLPGYESYSATFTKHVSGWVWGNLLFGGIIGLAVDAGTGGLYYLTPDDVSAQLDRKADSELSDNAKLHVFVTLHPSSKWKKVGQLKTTASVAG